MSYQKRWTISSRRWLSLLKLQEPRKRALLRSRILRELLQLRMMPRSRMTVQRRRDQSKKRTLLMTMLVMIKTTRMITEKIKLMNELILNIKY
jgi:hypothetical protein